MAVDIYKDGERSTCEAYQLRDHLDAGYTLAKNPPKKRGRKKKADCPAPVNDIADLSSLMEPADGPTSEG